MARLWTAGAELQTATAGIEYSANVTNAPAVETTTKRSGNAAWRISNTGAIEGFSQIHTAAQGEYFGRFYLYLVAMPTAAQITIAGWRQTGTQKIDLRLTSGGALQLYNYEDSAQIGSNSSALSTGTWYRIEMTYNSTTLAATTCSARIDGTQFASGTIDITATPNRLTICITGADATLDYIVDDLAINDTTGSFQNSWPGEGEVIVLRPNANGDNSGWVGSDANSTDNYLLVNEVPPSATTYVEENTSGTDAASADDYNLDATPAAMATSDVINVVHVGVYAAVSDITTTDPDIVLRIKATTGGTIEESAALDCNSATYQGPAPLPANSNYKLTLYDLPGASTTAWTKADLDTAQAGVRLSVTDAHFARVGALWVMVDHKPASGATLTADAGSYTVTGVATNLKWNRLLTASAGTYTLTGTAATLAKGYRLTADAGSFTLTGIAASLLWKRVLPANAGTYTLSGVSATLSRKITLTAGLGTLTETGTATSLLWKRVLPASAGSYTVTGTASNLLRGYKLTAGLGTYALTGIAATLTYTPIGGYTLTASAGSFAISGTAAGLLWKHILPAVAGQYAITGTAAGLRAGRLLSAGAGSYAVTGASVNLLHMWILNAALGTYTLTGTNAELAYILPGYSLGGVVAQSGRGSISVTRPTINQQGETITAGARQTYKQKAR